MKTLELEIVQGFFFYPHYAFRYIFVKLDFADQRNNLRSDLVKLYICLKQIIINYGN